MIPAKAWPPAVAVVDDPMMVPAEHGGVAQGGQDGLVGRSPEWRDRRPEPIVGQTPTYIEDVAQKISRVRDQGGSGATSYTCPLGLVHRKCPGWGWSRWKPPSCLSLLCPLRGVLRG